MNAFTLPMATAYAQALRAADADPEVRFIAASASVNSGFSRLSLVVEYGLSWHLPRIMGTARVSDFLLSGHAVSAAEAAELGLVNQMITDGDVLDHAVRYATDIARSCSPMSLAAIKARVYGDLERNGDLERSRADALTDALAQMDTSLPAATPGSQRFRCSSVHRSRRYGPTMLTTLSPAVRHCGPMGLSVAVAGVVNVQQTIPVDGFPLAYPPVRYL
ncbi:enoyl-CoA hydratase-related protein, partial [Frankia sp. CcWB2]